MVSLFGMRQEPTTRFLGFSTTPKTKDLLKANMVAAVTASAVAGVCIVALPISFGQIMGWGTATLLTGSAIGAMLLPLLEDLGLIVAAAVLFVGLAQPCISLAILAFSAAAGILIPTQSFLPSFHTRKYFGRSSSNYYSSSSSDYYHTHYHHMPSVSPSYTSSRPDSEFPSSRTSSSDNPRQIPGTNSYASG